MNIYMIFCTIVCTMIIAVSVLIGAVMVAVGLVNIIKERKKKMKDKIWLAPSILPEVSKDFIEEIIIEYENDLGTFHAIGLFAMDVDAPVFLEVLTGTKINWNKTVKRWRFYK